MTQKEMVALVRKLIADEQATGYTEGGNFEAPEGTQELLNYLDRAVDEYSRRLMEANNVDIVKTFTLTNGAELPEDFLGICGGVPVTVTNNTINYYGDEQNITARYFARLPYVTSYGGNDTLPYKQYQCIAITALAAIYALNKHEYNVSQDLMLLGYGGDNANRRQQTRQRT